MKSDSTYYKFAFWSGIIGVTLFSVASVLGGFLVENYDPVSQFISEAMAIDTAYGKELRYFGYVPSGILLTIFGFSCIKIFPTSKLTKAGFLGIGVFYGIATIIVGLFPCDQGCNKEFLDPSVSQIIHNITGLLTYMFVPVSIIFIGIGLNQSKQFNTLSKITLACGLICIAFVGLLFTGSSANYSGLYQRIVEATIIVWVIACCGYINKLKFRMI